MNYEQFITEIQKYWDLRKKGLKKQANSFLFSFTKSFKENVPDADADAVLFRFCREYLDEMKFPGDALPRRHLPFQLTKLLDDYLSRECEKNQMPQMRWAYQIFGNIYNPHDPKLEHDFYPILERAYMHENVILRRFSSISGSSLIPYGGGSIIFRRASALQKRNLKIL